MIAALLFSNSDWWKVQTICQFHWFLKHINFLNSASFTGILGSCLLAVRAERRHRHAGRQQRPHPGRHLPDGTDLPHHRGQTRRHLMIQRPTKCFVFECLVSNSFSLSHFRRTVSGRENSWPAVSTAWWPSWRSGSRSWWGWSPSSRTTNSDTFGLSSVGRTTTWRPRWRWWSRPFSRWRSHRCLCSYRWVTVWISWLLQAE